jgi:hypothetical protein
MTDEPCPEGFHWIGQSLDTCDNCGHPARAHAGLHSFRRDAGPFGGEWYCKPWAEVDASRGET